MQAQGNQENKTPSITSTCKTTDTTRRSDLCHKRPQKSHLRFAGANFASQCSEKGGCVEENLEVLLVEVGSFDAGALLNALLGFCAFDKGDALWVAGVCVGELSSLGIDDLIDDI